MGNNNSNHGSKADELDADFLDHLDSEDQPSVISDSSSQSDDNEHSMDESRKDHQLSYRKPSRSQSGGLKVDGDTFYDAETCQADGGGSFSCFATGSLADAATAGIKSDSSTSDVQNRSGGLVGNGLGSTTSRPGSIPVGIKPDPVMIAEYTTKLKPLRLQTYPFTSADPDKPGQSLWRVPYSYQKQAEGFNPISQTLSTRIKRIQREVATLSDLIPVSLDSSIFICIDENRPDLVKALLTGPEDTPYAHGCFEFDVFFPEQYPHKPPLVTFTTTGGNKVRFNPNLYANGYVCLSVINTWSGSPSEQWNPYLSLHKVLLAIQAFVFVKQPFFNEPGFGKMAGREWGEKCSRRYNARVRHATLLHGLLCQIRSPSPYFREVIREHCRIKAPLIKAEAQLWMEELQQMNAAGNSRSPGDEGLDGFDEFSEMLPPELLSTKPSSKKSSTPASDISVKGSAGSTSSTCKSETKSSAAKQSKKLPGSQNLSATSSPIIGKGCASGSSLVGKKDSHSLESNKVAPTSSGHGSSRVGLSLLTGKKEQQSSSSSSNSLAGKLLKRGGNGGSEDHHLSASGSSAPHTLGGANLESGGTHGSGADGGAGAVTAASCATNAPSLIIGGAGKSTPSTISAPQGAENSGSGGWSFGKLFSLSHVANAVAPMGGISTESMDKTVRKLNRELDRLTSGRRYPPSSASGVAAQNLSPLVLTKPSANSTATNSSKTKSSNSKKGSSRLNGKEGEDLTAKIGETETMAMGGVKHKSTSAPVGALQSDDAAKPSSRSNSSEKVLIRSPLNVGTVSNSVDSVSKSTPESSNLSSIGVDYDVNSATHCNILSPSSKAGKETISVTSNESRKFINNNNDCDNISLNASLNSALHSGNGEKDGDGGRNLVNTIHISGPVAALNTSTSLSFDVGNLQATGSSSSGDLQPTSLVCGTDRPNVLQL